MGQIVLQANGLNCLVKQQVLLKNLDFSLEKGQLVGIIGPNGAGKTSLLRALLGLLPIQNGSITVQGQRLNQLSAQQRAQTIAYLAQGQQVHWPLPVTDVVALGRLPYGDSHTKQGMMYVQQAIAQVHVADLAERNVLSLSGGEKARVLMARALATRAPILLADEPLAAIDPAHQIHMMQLLCAQAEQGQAVAVVLHDLTMASRFCHQVYVLSHGRVVAHGNPQQVLSDALLEDVFGLRVHRLASGEIVPWELS